MAIRTTVEFRNDNPNTVHNRLAAQLGREPTRAETVAEVRRILAAKEAPASADPPKPVGDTFARALTAWDGATLFERAMAVPFA